MPQWLKGLGEFSKALFFCRFAKARKLAKRPVKTHEAVRYIPRMPQWLKGLEELSNNLFYCQFAKACKDASRSSNPTSLLDKKWRVGLSGLKALLSNQVSNN